LPRSLKEIANLLGADLVGADKSVSGVAALDDAGPDDLSIFLGTRNAAALDGTRAGALIIARRAQAGLADGRAVHCPVLVVEDPRLALSRVLDLFYPDEPCQPGVLPGALVDARAVVDERARVEPGARIEPGARVGAGTRIGSGTVLCRDVLVGDDCRLGRNVVVRRRCRLGNRVRLGDGVVIGSRGFGFANLDQAQAGKRAVSIKQIGTVVIEDDVEIGANSTVDRATLGATRIGRGTKIDNLVQVGHNVVIGRDVIIAAQTGLSGSVCIGDGALLGGQVGVADHVTIGAGAQVGSKSGVGSDVPAGSRVAGYPAVPVGQWLRDFFYRYRRPSCRRPGAGDPDGEKK